MATCVYYDDICHRDAVQNSEKKLCILHSKAPDKSTDAFNAALAEHRQKYDGVFRYFVFPGEADFSEATFKDEADFRGATFIQRADFGGATFNKEAHFGGATLSKEACFRRARFHEGAYFFTAQFNGNADWGGARFTKETNFFAATFWEGASFFSAIFARRAQFSRATFTRLAQFGLTTFNGEADFDGATFNKEAYFSYAKFMEKALFSSRDARGQSVPIFAGAEVDFRWVTVDPPDALTFRIADLRKCSFLGTDMRKVEITGAIWPKFRGRTAVYDEIASIPISQTRDWPHVERLYRELKQNYEDHRDYGRAGDFHYGEKEMQRLNPGSPLGLKFILTLYWALSGYGERYLRPLCWVIALLVGCTILYLWLGVPPKGGGAPLPWAQWPSAAIYSAEVMTFLRPDFLTPVGVGGKLVHFLQSVMGPLILGLLGLAVRQRLKR
jgi:uncharacterized protein YjbI with pentapeptide repeats